MLETGEVTTRSLHLFHTEVEALGGTVRCTCALVVQDLLPPPLQGGAEGADLFDLVGTTARDGLAEEDGGIDDVVVR